jgi:hypothetical protein
MHECGFPTMSDETIGSSVNVRMPFQPSWPAALWKAAFTSSALASRPRTQTRSVTLPSGTGTRIAMPSIFPFSSGMTSAVAFAAPVVDGMMFTAAARIRRRSALPFRVSAIWSWSCCSVV